MTVWSPLGAQRERVERAADWLATQLPRARGAFMLVLGPAGVGKTFLLRQVARRLGRQQRDHADPDRAARPRARPQRRGAGRDPVHAPRRAVAPEGVPPRSRGGAPGAPVRWLRRARRCGCARRRSPCTSSGSSAAAVERARIVVSSRTEHFVSSGQVADLVDAVAAGATAARRHARARAAPPRPRGPPVRARRPWPVYLRHRLGRRAGGARLARLASVHDLVGPRLL